MVLLSERKDYFFWLYVVYFALQGWLALMAAFFYPNTSSLVPNESTADFTYEVLLSSCLTGTGGNAESPTASMLHDFCEI